MDSHILGDWKPYLMSELQETHTPGDNLENESIIKIQGVLLKGNMGCGNVSNFKIDNASETGKCLQHNYCKSNITQFGH